MAISSCVGKSWNIPSGVDPETAFKIEAKVEGFWNKQDDGKKVYVKGRMLSWVVDSDRFSLCDFNKDLLEQFSWGRCQTPKLWIIERNEGTKAELVSESQIPEMFNMYQNEREISLLVVVCDIDESSSARPIPSIETISQSQAKKEAEDLDHDGYVRINDEYIYLCDGENVIDQSNSARNATKEVHLDLDPVLNSLLEESTVEDALEHEPVITYDPDNPRIEVGASFPDVYCFRKALRQHAIKNMFECTIDKTDRTRFIGTCAFPNCHWRIHASMRKKTKTFVVKKLPHEHTCPSTTMIDGKMACKSWISDRVTDWLRKNPSEGPKAVQNKLQDEYRVKITYNKAWSGTQAARAQIHGSWGESFQTLYNFKSELEKICPGSIVEVEVETVGNKVRFNRAFVSLKPCIDGFLQGCRPYLGVDSTHLTGRYRGQLASACGIDGHNWLYPVAYGVFDAETKPNWIWFLTQLRKAIGTPLGLAISSDGGKGLAPAIASVFLNCEQRECMNHLMENFSKKFHGEEVAKHMKSASRAYTVNAYEFYFEKVKTLAPTAPAWLENNHKHIWCRSQFSELSKCDYENNNISESFNNWVRAFKSLHVVDLFDQIRQMIMAKFEQRRSIGDKLQGLILPNVTKKLNALSRKTQSLKILKGGDDYAELSGVSEGTIWRNVVELDNQQCACGEWQLTGKPCLHAVAFICTLRGVSLDDYVHEYYSLARFRAAYAGKIPAMNDKSKWEKVDLDFNVFPPLNKRPPGRPKNQRIPRCLELNKKRQQCKRCSKMGHHQRTCKEDDPEAAATKRKRRKGAQATQN